jgi:predicted nucleic acid-binding protein
MKLVVDTNIAFSAILNTNSRIANVLLQPQTKLIFYSTSQLLVEIETHRDKLQDLAGYSDHELNAIVDFILGRIKFINVELIPKEIYDMAESITYNVDIDDTEFIALTEFVNGRFWSGDKKLIRGLKGKGWDKFISLQEIQQLM